MPLDRNNGIGYTRTYWELLEGLAMASTHQSSTSTGVSASVFRESPLGVVADICPLCEQPIPPGKLGEIQQRERQRAAAHAERLRADFAKEKETAIAEKQSELDQLRQAAAAAAERAKRKLEKREEAVRDTTKKEVETAMTAKLTAVIQEKAATEEQLKTVKAEQERLAEERVQNALTEQRTVMEKAKTEAVQREQSKAFEERQNLQAKLEGVQRQMKKERADELGESAELDLGEALREAFPDDHFHRIDKGVAGADFWQDVMHSGELCGRIVYDSKNRNAWRNDYVDKLKTDQIDADGHYAVLATRVFPAGVKQLHIKDGVFVAHPARIIVLATILREQMIQTHRLQLSNEERDAKTAALYEFITSERCHQIFEHFDTLTSGLLDLDVGEKEQHKRNWKKRGQLIKKVERVIQVQLRDEIDRIIEDGAET